MKIKHRIEGNIIDIVKNSDDVKKFWNEVKDKKPKIQNEASELVLYDFVDDYMLTRVKTFLDKASGPVTVKLNSWGGDVFAGFAIFNEFSEYEGEITMKIMGMAASAAALIFLAGDKRYMRNASMLMFHKSWNVVIGNADDLKSMAETLDKIDGMMADMIVEKTEMKAGEVNDFLAKETFLTAKEAVEIAAAEEEDEPQDGGDEYDDPEMEEKAKEKAEKEKLEQAKNDKRDFIKNDLQNAKSMSLLGATAQMIKG